MEHASPHEESRLGGHGSTQFHDNDPSTKIRLDEQWNANQTGMKITASQQKEHVPEIVIYMPVREVFIDAPRARMEIREALQKKDVRGSPAEVQDVRPQIQQAEQEANMMERPREPDGWTKEALKTHPESDVKKLVVEVPNARQNFSNAQMMELKQQHNVKELVVEVPSARQNFSKAQQREDMWELVPGASRGRTEVQKAQQKKDAKGSALEIHEVRQKFRKPLPNENDNELEDELQDEDDDEDELDDEDEEPEFAYNEHESDEMSILQTWAAMGGDKEAPGSSDIDKTVFNGEEGLSPCRRDLIFCQLDWELHQENAAKYEYEFERQYDGDKQTMTYEEFRSVVKRGWMDADPDTNHHFSDFWLECWKWAAHLAAIRIDSGGLGPRFGGISKLQALVNELHHPLCLGIKGHADGGGYSPTVTNMDKALGSPTTYTSIDPIFAEIVRNSNQYWPAKRLQALENAIAAARERVEESGLTNVYTGLFNEKGHSQNRPRTADNTTHAPLGLPVVNEEGQRAAEERRGQQRGGEQPTVITHA
eukprot:gnl/MRDRNA2_/MRDRNA2_27064_c0_seq1.p1 gnl/MRDRNA2_/MRDRNA2_27064_c0~~gnl/MRDRNA2_/MRDRNA2_27064_c0_seq1.p1  ORF type:complete len:625 (-),score=135.98 gnl/MRDRNA2_/MRDRNA2_27064_c0_seq1:213-1826(-)